MSELQDGECDLLLQRLQARTSFESRAGGFFVLDEGTPRAWRGRGRLHGRITAEHVVRRRLRVAGGARGLVAR